MMSAVDDPDYAEALVRHTEDADNRQVANATLNALRDRAVSATGRTVTTYPAKPVTEGTQC